MLKYYASDYFMVRTPLLSLSDYFSVFGRNGTTNDRIQTMFNDPLLKETLAVASGDLLQAFEKTDFSKDSKAVRQIMSSITKYFIRLSTRPTPFGLFSKRQYARN